MSLRAGDQDSMYMWCTGVSPLHISILYLTLLYKMYKNTVKVSTHDETSPCNKSQGPTLVPATSPKNSNQFEFVEFKPVWICGTSWGGPKLVPATRFCGKNGQFTWCNLSCDLLQGLVPSCVPTFKDFFSYTFIMTEKAVLHSIIISYMHNKNSWFPYNKLMTVSLDPACAWLSHTCTMWYF